MVPEMVAVGGRALERPVGRVVGVVGKPARLAPTLGERRAQGKVGPADPEELASSRRARPSDPKEA